MIEKIKRNDEMTEKTEIREYGLKEVWDRTDNLSESITLPLTEILKQSLDEIIASLREHNVDGSLTHEQYVRDAIAFYIVAFAGMFQRNDGNWKNKPALEPDQRSIEFDEGLSERSDWPHQLNVPVSLAMLDEFKDVAVGFYPNLEFAERELIQNAMAMAAVAYSANRSFSWIDPG